MADANNRYYEMRRLSAVFACASVALLISLLTWIWVDLTPAWKAHQKNVAETRRALWQLDQLASGQAQTQPAPASEPLAIRQVVLPLVRRNLHFTQTATTDRCMTCHAGIDADSLSAHRLARRLTDALLHMNDRIRRQNLNPQSQPRDSGLGDQVSKVPAQTRPEDNGWIWPVLSPIDQTWLLRDLALDANRHLRQMGSSLITWENPASAHPQLDLYLSDRSPHPLKRMGCTVCHEGNGDETDFVLAGHARTPAATARGTMERPMLPAPYTEASCAKCHPQISDTTLPTGPAVARRLNHGRVLVERWGCVNCHLIEGFDNAPKVGPSLAKAQTTLDEQFFGEYVLSPPDVRPWTTMPQSFRQENNSGSPGSDAEIRSVAEIDAMWSYLSAVSQDDPSQPGRGWPVELQNPEIVAAGREQGRRLFNEIGCLACHPPIERSSGPYGVATSRPADLRKDAGNSETRRRADLLQADEVDVLFSSGSTVRSATVRYAPDLSNIGGERRGGPWIREWLADPGRYSPGARMPRMRLTTQPALSDGSVSRGLDESTALALYISNLKTGEIPATRPPAATGISPERYKAACETITREVLAAGESGQAAISRQFQAATSGHTPAAERIAAMSPDQRQWAFVGQRLLAHYGCAGCHQIPGLDSAPRIGPELTRWADKPAGQLDFGFFDPMLRRTETDKHFQRLYPTIGEQPWLPWVPDNLTVQIEKTHACFVWHKLRNPRIWDRGRDKPPLSRLRMPNFLMNNTQAGSLATFVLSRRSANVDASLIVSDQSPAGVAARGRNLARLLNCAACHAIDGNGAAIHAYYWKPAGHELHFQAAEAPPRLPGQGARVTAQRTYEYMRDVTTIRPWLSVRMPSFNLSDEQTTLLAEYFSAVSREQSKWLGEKLRTVKKAATHPAEPSPGSVPSAADVLFRTNDRETPQWEDAVTAIDRLRRFARSHGTIPAQWLDPIEADRPTFAKACDQALADATFLQQAYSIDHPFLDTPAKTATGDQIADGRTLFQELQCLQCHVFGNPAVPGANAHPTAPDLQQASRRLRRAWVTMWLSNPRRIQPGTRMPGFFGDGEASAFADYPPEDRAAVQVRLRNKSLIDDGPAQIQAIIAFVYDASSRQVDVVREAVIEPADQ
ncbi:MAG: c-type cytochrome [Phycisphaerae bacterium]|nr:c-type cytochrome [Phycisphaerae bacterium]